MDSMPSLYAQYLTERTDDKIVETAEGFATFRLISPKSVYIIDIFVLPQYRKNGVASSLAHGIVTEAKRFGCNELIGTVVPSMKNSTESIKALMAFGMSLSSSSDNLVVLRKDI